jgi:hypothetical protein
VAELRTEREILRKAAAYFAQETIRSAASGSSPRSARAIPPIRSSSPHASRRSALSPLACAALCLSAVSAAKSSEGRHLGGEAGLVTSNSTKAGGPSRL